MKKILIFLLFIFVCFNLSATYNLGDYVEDFSWQHSDGVNPISTTSITEQISAGKVVVLEYSASWCGYCPDAAIHLEEIWQEYGGISNNDLYLCSGLQDLDWEQLDGETWRDQYNLTYYLALSDLYNTASQFGIEGIPHAVIIDRNQELVYNGHPMSYDFSDALADAISSQSGGCFVEGIVLDENNSPIEDAIINVNNIETMTNDSGYYNIEISQGSFEIMCSRVGYYKETAEISIFEGQTISKDFQLIEISNAPHHFTGRNNGLDIKLDWMTPGNQELTSRELLFDQQIADSSITYYTSDSGLGNILFDDFNNVYGIVSTISFVGITQYHNGDEWQNNDENPMTFEISIFENDNNQLGNQIFTDTPSLEYSIIGETVFGDDLCSWTYNFENPIYLESGWLSIQGISESEPESWFLWAESTEGMSLTNQSGEMLINDCNMTFSMEGTRNLTGYNIYRDNAMIAELSYDQLSFTDNEADVEIEHSYYVSAVYSNGIEINSETLILEAEEASQYGDIDVNGAIQAYDASITLQYVTGFDPIPEIDPTPWEENRLLWADVDGNTILQAFDASLILKYSAGIIDEFPVQDEDREILNPDEFVKSIQISSINNCLVFSSEKTLQAFEISCKDSDVSFGSASTNLDDCLISQNGNKLSFCSLYGTTINETFLSVPFDASDREFTLTLVEDTFEYEIVVNPEMLNNHEIPAFNNGLIGNYPNPFNPTTNIKFSVKENNTNVSLKIYNVKGQLVKEFAHEIFNSGEHQIQWNSYDTQNKAVSSGVYFSRISIGDKVFIRKMLLMK
jgi:thiol-disulfide isomerase/thioredoxin